MRVALADPVVTVAPGEAACFELDVTNTGMVIDGATARVVGLDEATVTSDPTRLALFPDTTGRLTLKVSPPRWLPAGTHRLGIDVESTVDPDDREYVDADLVVLPDTSASLTMLPTAVNGHRRGRFSLVAANEGNTALDLALAGTDPQRALRVRCNPPLVVLPPGASANAEIRVRARRHFFGGEVTHALTLTGTNASGPPLEVIARAQYHQRPTLPRGAVTALILLSIIGLWAGALLFGMSHVLSGDKLTKDVPASFFASTPPAGAGGGALAGASSAAFTAAAAPPGAIPKTGGAGAIGGAISGTVTAYSTHRPVGRITVQAVRDSDTGPIVAATAATGQDGTYSLEGLFPDSYRVHFSADGFADRWFPDSATPDGATPIDVAAQSLNGGTDMVVTGLPGAISGNVRTGTQAPTPVTITVVPAAGGLAPPVSMAVTDLAGHYVIPSLPTPGQYQLTLSAAGFQSAVDTETLNGGETRDATTIQLSAATGEIDGTVTDGTTPLGGVAITANANGVTLTSATPTSGTVGRFALTALSTPASYLVTFSKDGFGSTALVIALGPGQSEQKVAVTLHSGTGSISGHAKDPSGQPLANVSVTVRGGAAPATAATLSSGNDAGAYTVSGLAAPGSYTVTFALDGYSTQTVKADLTTAGPAVGVDATLSPTAATVKGVARGPDGNGLPGVKVVVSDGATPHNATTASDPAGAYTVVALPPGDYSVTFTADGYQSQTALIHLDPGATVEQDAMLKKAS